VTYIKTWNIPCDGAGPDQLILWEDLHQQAEKTTTKNLSLQIQYADLMSTEVEWQLMEFLKYDINYIVTWFIRNHLCLANWLVCVCNGFGIWYSYNLKIIISCYSAVKKNRAILTLI